MILLDTSETLKKILDFLPLGHPLRSLADKLAIAASASAIAVGPGAAEILAPGRNFWKGSIGILGGSACQNKPLGALLLWLEEIAGQDQQESPDYGRSRQLILDLTPGRYRIEYWVADSPGPMGVEIATGPKLVLGPPRAQRLVVAVRAL